MKFNANLFYLLTVFYFVDAAGYAIWWNNSNGGFEPIGTAAIAMLGFMSVFLGFYLKNTSKRQGVVPEDRLDANIEDCLLYTSPSPRDRSVSRMPSSA